MRVFVTGATGFIGSAVVRELIGAGHTVTGLARTSKAAKRLVAAGAEAHHGTLHDPDSLRQAAAAADGVIHLAFAHGLSGLTLAARLRALLGGAPAGIVPRFMAATTGLDRHAIDALAAALASTGRPLVTAFGTMGLVPGGRTGEEDEPDPRSPGAMRGATERVVLDWAARGVRASIIRLPPSVHGDGDKGLIPRLIGAVRRKRLSAFFGDGRNRWPAVHRLDAARLFRLALEQGEAGGRYHAVADEGVAFRDIAGVIGRRLGVPVESRPANEAPRLLGWLGPFAAADNPASSARTRERLGWQPQQPGLLADLDRPGYFGR